MSTNTRQVLFCAAIYFLVSGCASRSAADIPRRIASLDMQCPVGTVRHCDTWGGNRFKKRYNECICSIH